MGLAIRIGQLVLGLHRIGQLGRHKGQIFYCLFGLTQSPEETAPFAECGRVKTIGLYGACEAGQRRRLVA